LVKAQWFIRAPLQLIYNILAGILDEGINILYLGSRRQTISARLGSAIRNDPKWFAFALHWFTNNVLFFWQADHCGDAYDPRVNNTDQTWSWEKGVNHGIVTELADCCILFGLSYLYYRIGEYLYLWAACS
jgi:hypothetical protein